MLRLVVLVEVGAEPCSPPLSHPGAAADCRHIASTDEDPVATALVLVVLGCTSIGAVAETTASGGYIIGSFALAASASNAAPLADCRAVLLAPSIRTLFVNSLRLSVTCLLNCAALERDHSICITRAAWSLLCLSRRASRFLLSTCSLEANDLAEDKHDSRSRRSLVDDFRSLKGQIISFPPFTSQTPAMSCV